MARAARLKTMIAEVEQYDRDYILGVDVGQLVAHLWQKYRFEVPVIHFDRKVIVDHGESGRGVYVRVSFPFEGSREALHMRPMTYQGGCLDGNVSAIDIEVTYNGPDSSVILAKMQREQQATELALKFLGVALKLFDNELQGQARLAIEQKREIFERNKRIVDGLGIPKLTREGSPPTYPAPEVRRKPPITLPPVIDQPSDPTVEIAEYEHILEIILSMVKTMERSPATFASMGEESIRDIILVNLNGHYKGQATGETFNANGKTDILIRVKDSNIFIAECKFWEGEKSYLGAIDQLLGYVTWRDTKTAIILFSRRKDFSAVLNQIPEITKSHHHYRCSEPYPSETGFRFIFSNASDSAKKLWLTVVVFDVPSVD